MSLASVINTRCTVWPLMSSPRMAAAFSCASSGVLASFTPPALPRPPVLTWALTTTVRAQLAGRRGGLLGRLHGPARQHRDSVRGEQILCLILVKVHWLSRFPAAHSGVCARCADPSDARRTHSDLVR